MWKQDKINVNRLGNIDRFGELLLHKQYNMSQEQNKNMFLTESEVVQ